MPVKNVRSLFVCTALAAGLARPQSADPLEPNGGSWKTWVLSSGAQLRLPAPPSAADTAAEIGWIKAAQAGLDHNSRNQIAFWDQASPSYHWVKWLQDRILKDAPPTFASARQLALLNVAIYDALVAAWDSKYAYQRPLPFEVDAGVKALVTAPKAPSYPNEFAVASAAAVAVLSYLYPAEATSLQIWAEEAGRSRLYAGVAYPSDYFAGLKLGDQVGQLVVRRAMTDGSAVPWTGSVPTGPGLWSGTNPACPLCGTWKPYLLMSGDQFRPTPPLVYNSAAKQAELAELKSQPRTFNDQATAFYWQSNQGQTTGWFDLAHTAIFEEHLAGNALRAARVYALIAAARYDGVVACWDGKYAYWAIRPFQLDPTLTTLFATPNHPSYPAAHATLSMTMADVLAYLFPTRSGLFNRLGAEAGNSRVWAGIHYSSDVDAGNTIGHKVAQLFIDWANRDGSAK